MEIFVQTINLKTLQESLKTSKNDFILFYFGMIKRLFIKQISINNTPKKRHCFLLTRAINKLKILTWTIYYFKIVTNYDNIISLHNQKKSIKYFSYNINYNNHYLQKFIPLSFILPLNVITSPVISGVV